MLSLDIGLSVWRILCCFLLQPTGLQFTVLGGKRNALLCNIVLQLCKGLGCSWQHSTESLFNMSTPLKTDNYTIAMRNFASISYLNNVLLSVQVFLFCTLSPFRGDETSFSCPSLSVSCGEHFILGLSRGRLCNSCPSCLRLVTALSLLSITTSSCGGSSQSPFKILMVESVSPERKRMF